MRDDRYADYGETYDERPARAQQAYQERPARARSSRPQGEYQRRERPAPAAQEEYAEEQAAYEERPAQRAAGRASSQGRGGRSAAPAAQGNPVLDALKTAGGAVAGVVGGLVEGISARRAQAHAVVYEQGDYTGTGSPCRMCGNPVDHQQSRCPHCGTFVHPLYKRPKFWIAVVVLVALVIVLTSALSSCKSDTAPSGDTAGTATSTADLQTLIDTAEATLTEQSQSHPYTRFTAYNLRQAVTAAENAVADTSSTQATLSEVATNLSNAQAAILSIVGTYDWPTFSDLVSNPANNSTKQVAVSATVASVGETQSNGLCSMVIQDPSNADNQLTVYYYPWNDVTAEFSAGANVSVYGEFVYDGTNMALWADKVEVFS